MERMMDGVMGATNEGQPIVTQTHSCPFWTAHNVTALCPTRECWYCKYTDFQKSTDVMLETSICLHPKNQVQMEFDSEQEYLDGGKCHV